MMEEEKNIPAETEETLPVSGDNEKKEGEKPLKRKNNGRAPMSARTKRRVILVSIVAGVLLLALIATLIVTSILDNRPPEFSLVRERFVGLIESSQTLNEVIWGAGLPTYRRVERNMKQYTIEFKEKEETLRYFEFEDDELGVVVSYEYQIRRMEDKVNADGVKIYTVYDVETGGILTEYKQGAARFAQRSNTPIEGKELLFQSEYYYYYALPNYENPDIAYDTIVYSGREDENYDYVRFDCAYKSTEELQKAIAAVYANDYIGPLYENLFTGAFGGMNDVYQPIYADFIDDEGDGAAYLMKANNKTIWKGTTLRKLTFDYDSMQMIEEESNAREVKVSIQYREQGKEDVQTMIVSFALESGAWLINSPTY